MINRSNFNQMPNNKHDLPTFSNIKRSIIFFVAAGLFVGLHSSAYSQQENQIELQIYADSHEEVVNSFVAGYLQHHHMEHTIDEFVSSLTHALHLSGYPLATVTATSGENETETSLLIRLGTISEINATSFENQKSRDKSVEILTKHLVNRPAHQLRMERAMMLVNDLSDVSARFELQEKSPGIYQLHAKNQSVEPRFTAQYDFLPTQEFERNRLSLAHRQYSFLTGGDLLRLHLTAITGNSRPSQIGGGVFYRTPLGNDGLYGSFAFSDLRSRVEILGQDNRDFEGRSISTVLGYPVSRDAHGYEYLIGEIQRTDEKIEGFGDVNQVDLARIVFASKHSNLKSDVRDFSLSITSGRDEDPSVRGFSHFRMGIGNVWTANQITSGAHFKAELLMQISGNTLPNSEKFFLGSHQSSRGYSYSSEIGDSGVSATAEIGKPLNIDTDFIINPQHGLFFDLGAVKSQSGDQLARSARDLYSTGYFLKASLNTHWHLNSWIATPLKKNSRGIKPNPNFYIQLQGSW